MFEEKIDARIIVFVTFIVVSFVVGILFEDTSFGNFLVNISLIFLFIGIIIILFYLITALFIDINDRKKELENKLKKKK